MTSPSKAAQILLAHGSLGDPDEDLFEALKVLLVVAEARYGGSVSPRPVVRALVHYHGREAIAAMVNEVGAN